MPSIVKKTLRLIVDKQHDYVIAVKRNCSKLHTDITRVFAEQKPLTSCKTAEKAHGRIENREIKLCVCPDEIAQEWAGAKRLIEVHRYGSRGNDQLYDVKQYYISSLESDDAERFAMGIRGHWGIENKLHWVKDVFMNEDKSPIKCYSAAKIMALLRSLCLTIYRVSGYLSWKQSLSMFANRINKLVGLVRI